VGTCADEVVARDEASFGVVNEVEYLGLII